MLEKDFVTMLKQMDFDLDPGSLARTIDEFPRTRVLVIGDIIMDEYIWGDVSRISPEAPVPVVDVKHETKMLGGAGNVVNNISSLGGEAILCGVVGDDTTGRQVVKAAALPTCDPCATMPRPWRGDLPVCWCWRRC